MSSYFLHMLLIEPPGLHMFACLQVYIMRVPDVSCRKPAPPKKPRRCQAFTDGWRVQPTLDIPSNLPSTKEAPAYGVGTTRTAPGARNQPGHRKRKHETYLPQRPKTKRKMGLVLVEQPSVHASTSEPW